MQNSAAIPGHSGGGYGLHSVIGKQAFQHVLVGMAQGAVDRHQPVESFHDRHIFPLFCQPERSFTADQTAAYDHGGISAVLFPGQDLSRRIYPLVITQGKYLRPGAGSNDNRIIISRHNHVPVHTGMEMYRNFEVLKLNLIPVRQCEIVLLKVRSSSWNQVAAQPVALFEQLRLMASHRQHPGGLTACRAAAHDHHPSAL